ncbi:HesA/MoeB/ThiF family protein [Methanococcoides methylutens]|uniref:HesA/MoeB/ThiF family protein n=1 Tax=Methanococcoides methylutens TaxID=2226 RepID=UPI0040447507
MKLTSDQRERYAKHIIMKPMGEEGQKRLLESRVLCVGSGGLGSPVIQYLAAAGIGTLGIIDNDIVEMSNLQRQVIHAGNLGRPKVESAKEYVESLNPDVTVVAYEMRLNPGNVEDLIRDYDVVVDCSDNFATRYLLNDACVLNNKPLFHGSIFMFEGQVMTILPHEGPCYRCIFSSSPSTDAARTAGVMGILPGVIGTMQATEVVKYISRLGKSLVGRMIYYDALGMRFDEITVNKNPKCPVCGKDPQITSIDAENY